MALNLVLYFVIMYRILLQEVHGITLKQECPQGEVHKSCSFQSEYTCWMSMDRLDRVQVVPKRLSHCKAGCFCKKGLVREFPAGPCIVTAGCRNRKLHAILKNLPTLDIWIN